VPGRPLLGLHLLAAARARAVEYHGSIDLRAAVIGSEGHSQSVRVTMRVSYVSKSDGNSLRELTVTESKGNSHRE